jgi:hypothetical protein
MLRGEARMRTACVERYNDQLYYGMAMMRQRALGVARGWRAPPVKATMIITTVKDWTRSAAGHPFCYPRVESKRLSRVYGRCIHLHTSALCSKQM